MSFFTVCFGHRATAFCLTLLRRDGSSLSEIACCTNPRVGTTIVPGLRKRFGRAPPASARRERCFRLPAPGETDWSQLHGVEAGTESCTGSGEVEAGTFPLPELRTSQATIGADLLASGSSRCFASLKFSISLLICRSCRSASCLNSRRGTGAGLLLRANSLSP
jgi:hypothetical protein